MKTRNKNPALRSRVTRSARAERPESRISDYYLVRGHTLTGKIRAVAFNDAADEATRLGWLKDTQDTGHVWIVGPDTVTGVRQDIMGRTRHSAASKAQARSARDVVDAYLARVTRTRNPADVSDLPWAGTRGATETALRLPEDEALIVGVVKQGHPRHPTPWAVFIEHRFGPDHARRKRRSYLTRHGQVYPQSFDMDQWGQDMAQFKSAKEARKAAAAYVATYHPQWT